MKEKKYLNLIVIVPIIFLISAMLLLLYISHNNFNAIAEAHFNEHSKRFIEMEKHNSKQKINNVFKYIKHIKAIFPDDIKKQKKLVKKFIIDEKDINRYIFVLEKVDLNGGDKFAKMLINPNRTDLVGDYIDDSFKDTKGKEFFKEANIGLKASGETFVSYYLKKLSSDKFIEKISYFKYSAEYNWIVGTGVYIDDIYMDMLIEKKDELKILKKLSYKITLISTILVVILVVILYLLMKKLKVAIQKRDKKIEQENENYKILFNQIPNATWIIDADNGKIIDTNDASIYKYGYTRDEFLNLSVFDLDPSNNEKIAQHIKELNHLDKSDFETLHITKSAKEMNVAVNAVKILFRDKECILAVTTDITDRITAQREIEQQAEVLDAVVNILKELISNRDFNSSIENILKEVVNTLDVDRVYIFENDTVDDDLVCSQKFEYTKNDIPTQIENHELQNISYSNSGLRRWKDRFLNHKYIEGLIKEFPQSEKDILEPQEVKSVLVIPIWYKKEFWGFIGFDDCTDERVWSEIEKDVLKTLANAFIAVLFKENYNTQLQEQVKLQINEIRKKDSILLEQSKLAQMGEMLNMIAHQWRQPLNAMSASAINLSMKNEFDILEKKDIVQTSEFIQTQTQDMSKTIDDFMLFNKPETNKEFSLYEAISQVSKIISPQLKNRSITLEIDVDKDIRVFHNSKNIEHVLLNLLINSRDAFEDGLSLGSKKINIYSNIDKDNISLIIKDNAGGIPEDIIKKIFNPYFTTKEQGKGTGIGLYMSKQMVESISGNTIGVEVIDGDTLFTIRFEKVNKS